MLDAIGALLSLMADILVSVVKQLLGLAFLLSLVAALTIVSLVFVLDHMVG